MRLRVRTMPEESMTKSEGSETHHDQIMNPPLTLGRLMFSVATRTTDGRVNTQQTSELGRGLVAGDSHVREPHHSCTRALCSYGKLPGELLAQPSPAMFACFLCQPTSKQRERIFDILK